jgi:ribose transport system ATP-binding protein
MRKISKSFPGVQALEDVDFDLAAGEVHVLLGENGAGKSTLIKILAGANQPDSGEILIDGDPVTIRSAGDAERLGIATIYQEFNLVPQLSVAENVYLGKPPRRLGFVDRRRMRNLADEALARVGLQVDPTTPVAQLGIAQQQLVEIAKALTVQARVLVMDEPTATLTTDEVGRLFGVVRELTKAGVGVVFISHHLEEVSEIGDRVTVLRDGKRVGELPADAAHDEFVRLMVGRTIDAQYPRRRGDVGDALLTVRGLSRRGVFQDIDLTVHAGEVVGMAGLVGAGRSEVARAIFGADPYDEGEVEVLGRPVPRHSVAEALEGGLGLVPEDRGRQGLVLPLTVADNLALVSMGSEQRLGFVDRRGLARSAGRISEQLRIRAHGLSQIVATLSGGNQQKVVIGKWLLANTKVLILDEPTRGIDVGAKVEIYQLINQLTEQGAAVLMISSDLPEVIGMSDRVLVMAGGRIRGELDAGHATQESVMALAVQQDGGRDGV